MLCNLVWNSLVQEVTRPKSCKNSEKKGHYKVCQEYIALWLYRLLTFYGRVMKHVSRCQLFSYGGGCLWPGGKMEQASHSFAHFGVITHHAEHLNSAGKDGEWGFTHLIQSTDVYVPVLKSKLPCSSWSMKTKYVHLSIASFSPLIFLSWWQQLPLIFVFLEKSVLNRLVLAREVMSRPSV